MSNFEVVKTDSGKFSLFVNEQFVAEYTRKSSAIRGYERFVASMQSEQFQSEDCESECTATSNTGD